MTNNTKTTKPKQELPKAWFGSLTEIRDTGFPITNDGRHGVQYQHPSGMHVQIIADSISPSGKRLTTFQLAYPRFVHSELMTHRVFSRNASSSRAIPVVKMLDEIHALPAMPVFFGKNQAGMQSHESLDEKEYQKAVREWYAASKSAMNHSKKMHEMECHKQVANRVLEPFQFIKVIVTATEFDNFFELRHHTDADPTILLLANIMRQVRKASVPHKLKVGEWHLPYITEEERSIHSVQTLIKFSVARCARVSYNLHDGSEPDHKKDVALYERLIVSKPVHASPIEHQACAISPQYDKGCLTWIPDWVMKGFGYVKKEVRSNNFVGFRQAREIAEHPMCCLEDGDIMWRYLGLTT